MVSRRSKRKHPALERRFNTKARRYFIDTDYKDGVVDENGELVMRPLTEEEKDFLNRFYNEWLNASFPKDDTLMFTDEEDRKKLRHDNYMRNSGDTYNIIQRTGGLVYGGELIDALIKDPNMFIDPEEYMIMCEEEEELDRVSKSFKKIK